MRRLALVVAVAIAGFAAAIVRFSAADTSQACVVDAPTDSSLAARFDASVSMDSTNHTIDITRNGQPVSGASVCINTWMIGMSGMAMTTGAYELSPGHYDVPFQFAMAGPWQATVIVTPKGGAQTGTPVRFDVAAGATPTPAPGATRVPAPGATPGG